MTFSSMYHLCERNYRSHNLSGPRVIIFPSFLKRFLRDPTNPPAISPVNEEKLLLSLDRAFSLLAVGGIFLTCGFRTIAAVSTTIETAWVGPTAVTCLVLSELLGNKWVLAYSILHSVSMAHTRLPFAIHLRLRQFKSGRIPAICALLDTTSAIYNNVS
ncbi:hypothetical protein BC829DRAFT_155299 [Chytridium lagenaria]|nr:hypothetical protein BC829DRAFT_155299 [Chytridium lagenaria]